MQVSLRETALVGASSEGHIEIVKILLDHGADVNYPDYGFRPLQEAFLRGHKEVVQMLLDHGADVNPLGYFRCFARAPLVLASTYGHKEVVQMLLENGADADYWRELQAQGDRNDEEVGKALQEWHTQLSKADSVQ